jgi:DNA modification methylase
MINNIHNGKAEDVILELEDNSIDCVVTSPPYNIDINYDAYADDGNYIDFLNNLKLVFSRLKPKLKDGGRVCINIADKKNGRVPTHSDITNFMTMELGYLMYTTIVWEKSQLGSRTAWGSFKSPSSPSFPTPFEFILVFAKDRLKLPNRGETDLDHKEFIDWSLALWKFAPEGQMLKKYDHPAMFPEELPKRCIKMFTYKNATILDMYAGAGTTCAVAKMMDRNFIGIDISEKYCKTAQERCDKIYSRIDWGCFLGTNT